MKAVYILGILLFMLATVSSASAETVKLDFSNTPGATDYVNVFANYNGNKITFSVEENTTGITARIDKIGFNIPIDYVQKIQIINEKGKLVTVYNVTDNIPEYWTESDIDQNMDHVGSFSSFFASSGSKANNVIVTLNEGSDSNSLIGTNQEGFKVAAHVAWGIDSAFFAGPYTPDTPTPPDTQIPEFPTVAMPIAAILGLLFISQRRKEN